MIQLTTDRWREIWDGINADFPAYRSTEAILARQGGEWYGELKRFSMAAVNFAWTQYRKDGERRPKLANLLALAAKYERWEHDRVERRALQELPPPDPNKCECNCGGLRWHRVGILDDGRVVFERMVIECVTRRINLRPPESERLDSSKGGCPRYRVEARAWQDRTEKKVGNLPLVDWAVGVKG